MAQQVKDPVLSLQQVGWLLWHRSDPWLENFRITPAKPKKEKKEKEKERKEIGGIAL